MHRKVAAPAGACKKLVFFKYSSMHITAVNMVQNHSLSQLPCILEAGVVLPAGEADEAATLAPVAVGAEQALGTPAIPATLSGQVLWLSPVPGPPAHLGRSFEAPFSPTRRPAPSVLTVLRGGGHDRAPGRQHQAGGQGGQQ